MAASKPLNVEVVLIGYVDSRIDAGTAFGFVLRTGSDVVVHYRNDVDHLNLPPMFRFTTVNLPKIIRTRCAEPVIDSSASLYETLLKRCFDGLGSFRCWQPINAEVRPGDIDGFVLEVRELVDKQMNPHITEIEKYKETCSPQWQRLPQPAPLDMPPLTPATA